MHINFTPSSAFWAVGGFSLKWVLEVYRGEPAIHVARERSDRVD
jgi:hypothetical protein